MELSVKKLNDTDVEITATTQRVSRSSLDQLYKQLEFAQENVTRIEGLIKDATDCGVKTQVEVDAIKAVEVEDLRLAKEAEIKEKVIEETPEETDVLGSRSIDTNDGTIEE